MHVFEPTSQYPYFFLRKRIQGNAVLFIKKQVTENILLMQTCNDLQTRHLVFDYHLSAKINREIEHVK